MAMAPGRKTIAGAAGLLLLGLAGCGSNDTDPRTKVVCTTGMVADFVRNIGGERVRVTQLMGEGVDPHRYKASIGDVHKLNGADIVFYSGLHLEGKMGDIFERTAARRPTYAVAEGIDPKYRLQ